MHERLIYPARRTAGNLLVDACATSTIGSKALIKAISFLDNRANRFPDDITQIERDKHLGILTASMESNIYDFSDGDTGRIIGFGFPVIELHLPPVSPKDRSLVRARNSLELLARYIVTHNLHKLCHDIVGITDEKLAEASSRFGFSVYDYPFSEKEVKMMEKEMIIFQRAGLMKRGIRKMVLIHQSMEEFLARFAKEPSFKFTFSRRVE
jgi:hypothetical protein